MSIDPTPSNLDVLRDLNRVKVLFQAKTIAAVMGLPHAAPSRTLNDQPGENDAR